VGRGGLAQALKQQSSERPESRSQGEGSGFTHAKGREGGRGSFVLLDQTCWAPPPARNGNPLRTAVNANPKSIEPARDLQTP
jgi:hypothetical protein